MVTRLLAGRYQSPGVHLEKVAEGKSLELQNFADCCSLVLPDSRAVFR